MRTIRHIAHICSTIGTALLIALATGANRSGAADAPAKNSEPIGSNPSTAKPDPAKTTTNNTLGARLRLNGIGDVVVVAVRRNGPADRRGIRPGDQLVSVDGIRIASIADVNRALRGHNSDQGLKVVIRPSAQPRYITLESPRSQAANSNPPHPAMMGVTLDEEDRRVTVSQLYSGGPAEKAGVKTGDVIDAIDGHAVATDQDVLHVLRPHKVGESVDLLIERNGWRRDLRVTLTRPASLAGRPLLTESSETITRAQSPIVEDVTDEDEGDVVGNDEWQDADTYDNIRDPFLRARDTDFDG